MGTFTVAEIVGPVSPRAKEFLARASKELTSASRDYLAQATEALVAGKRVLIVGSKGSNFEDRLRLDPRFEFWDSTDPNTVTREIPVRVGAMILLKYLPHNLHSRLCAEAARLGFKPLVPIQSTGQARKLLNILARLAENQTITIGNASADLSKSVTDPNVEAVLSPLTPPPAPPEPAPAEPTNGKHPRPYSRGLLAVISPLLKLPRVTYTGEIQAEAERLLPLVTAAFPSADLRSVQGAIYTARRKKGFPATRKTLRPEPVVVAPVAKEPVSEPVLPPDPGLADGLETLVQACTLFLKAAPLVVERLNAMNAEVERLKTERDDYKERLDVMAEAITRPIKK